MKNIIFMTLIAFVVSGCGRTDKDVEVSAPEPVAAEARIEESGRLDETKPDKSAFKPAPVTVDAAKKLKTETAPKEVKQELKVTFIELGSVGCVPCKMMQPIMDELEKEYPVQLKILFYDVWKPEGRPYAQKYGIRAIPTQVFLDKDGKEYFRHTGFFPKAEIVKVLEMQGVK